MSHGRPHRHRPCPSAQALGLAQDPRRDPLRAARRRLSAGAVRLYPIFTTLLLSLKNADGSLTLHWYVEALTGVNLSVLFTTLRISAETALLSLVFGFILANAISRLKPLWRHWPC
ncbi:hypothetical protein PV963_01660 [Streptomyces coeruleorubidus]|uniref:hypothetical protein n=1 Tax=Streptomyces coeruleorubidus TaxID=116188 RepID=UPI00237F64A8|nr:hypothetical protein [Streptomyces coeruleorubidus]WDV49246.1 hypothetical protein PV963_01660 [Streptomyces coeruleorubidus]